MNVAHKSRSGASIKKNLGEVGVCVLIIGSNHLKLTQQFTLRDKSEGKGLSNNFSPRKKHLDNKGRAEVQPPASFRNV